MARFFLNEPLTGKKTVILAEQQAQHARVLRLKDGDEVFLSDCSGTDFRCKISAVSGQEFCLEILSEIPSEAEPRIFVSVYMAFPKADKLEHVIQKATELGASEIVAFPTSRCVAKYDEKSLEKKLSRWRKIAEAAAEQSGRGIIPDVLVLPSYEAALDRASGADKPLFFYENERANTLTATLSGEYQTVSLMTGPEGGFSVEEAEMASRAGLSVCTLGRRILRCETAPLCALSAVMFAAGEY